jgi:HEPN domain-containing protein
MKTLTREWIEKAEADFRTATRELRARKGPNYDAVCFHAQQCVEKYLKARLQEADAGFEKTHNLIALLEEVLRIEPLWESMRTTLALLNAFGVAYRYPGESADKRTATEALRLCRGVRADVRSSLRLRG